MDANSHAFTIKLPIGSFAIASLLVSDEMDGDAERKNEYFGEDDERNCNVG